MGGGATSIVKSAATGGGIGGLLGGGAGAVTGGGALGGLASIPVVGGLLGKLGGALKGKKFGPDPESAEVKALKLKGLRSISGQLDLEKKTPSGEAIARLGVARELKGLTGAREHASRKLQESIARRGLGSTSAGLAQEVGLGRRFGESAANIRASLPERIQQQRIARSQRISGLGGQLSGQVGQIPLRFQGGRKGGLAPLLGLGAGAGLGALAGGPQGAAAGGQIGGGLGQMFAAS